VFEYGKQAVRHIPDRADDISTERQHQIELE